MSDFKKRDISKHTPNASKYRKSLGSMNPDDENSDEEDKSPH